MARRPWQPTAKSELLVLMQNFLTKIDGYATALGMTPVQVGAAQDLCEAIIGAINVTEQCKTTMQAVTQWRDSVLTGEPVGTTAPAAPVFPVIGAVVYKLGSLTQFVKLREQIVASPGYTVAIGEDLGIVGGRSAAARTGFDDAGIESMDLDGILGEPFGKYAGHGRSEGGVFAEWGGLYDRCVPDEYARRFPNYTRDTECSGKRCHPSCLY